MTAEEILKQGTYTCVACRGDTVLTATERGVRPLTNWLREGADLRGFAAADKVVGKAAAFLYVLLGIESLYAGVISRCALQVLEQEKISVRYDTLVPNIINRRGDGICPFEAAVLETEDPKEAKAIVFEKIRRMDMDNFVELAIEEARRGIRAGEGGPFGCVIVKDGKVIGRGHNQVVRRKDPTCHGEVMAIRDACANLDSFDLSGCELYTTGEPCPMCMGAILWANIPKVFYGCDIKDTETIGFRDQKFYEVMADPANSEVITYRQTGRQQCLELYEEYRHSDKTEY